MHPFRLSGTCLALSAFLYVAGAAWAQQAPTTKYEYDAVGNLTKVTDPRGLATNFAYDALGRRTQVQTPPASAGGGGSTTVFNYDGQDRVTKVTDPRSLVTAYTVDGLGNLTQQQSPDTGVTNATYDAAGNLLTRTDARGKTTTYSYDVLNRLTRAAYVSGIPSVFEYDGGTSPLPNDIGRLTKVTDESGSTRLQYDGFGNLLQKAQTSTANGASKSQTVAYAYGTSGNTAGKRISQTYPSGIVIGYTYDGASRIAGLSVTTGSGSSALLSNIQYQPFGAPTGWTWGNGTAYARSFDRNGRLTQFPLGATSGAGATPNGLSRTVNYDTASRITAYTHIDTSGAAALAANQTFGYDDQDRLISYLPATSSQSYTYDANGNRTGQTVGSSSYSQTIDPASNRQTASTGPTPTANSYDAAGNQTGDGSTTYSYSDRGRLASVTKAGATTSYLYNGFGQRTVKQGTNVPTRAVRYMYDDAGHLIGEYDQAGTALQETVYLGDTPVATLKNGTVYYIYADQIDTPRVITDTNNLMVWRWDQADPFGVAQPDPNPSSLGDFAYNLRFPGQVYDAETGKHYNLNRDYDPSTGRYIQADPIGLYGGSPSTYSYVNGNPISYTDASGLCPWCVAWGLVEIGLIANEVATADVPMIGGGVGRAIARSTARMAGQIGREGEAAVRASCDIGSKETLTINGRTRIPDGLIPGVSLSEVKNVSRQSATQQIRDYVAYAEANGLRVDLYTRMDTRLSGPLQQMISDGRINLLPILPKK